MYPSSPCGSCGDPVVTATGPRGDMYFNPEPSLAGAYRLRDTGGTKPNATRLTTTQAFGLKNLYTLHSQTCNRAHQRTRARSS